MVLFAHNCEYMLSKRLLEGYLHQPYTWFLNNNSADLGKTILSEIAAMVGRGIKNCLELISKGMTTLRRSGLLIAGNPKSASTVGISLCSW